jgi:hypothetical protein
MLPDFSVLFHCPTVKPLRFRVRGGANFVHDIQFLSSYLHDARFTPAAVTRRGKKLLIPVHRDCWEFGLTRRSESSELHTASSRFTISPVSSMRWEANDLSCLGREQWIESIYLGSAHWETPEVSEIVISAPHAQWKLCVSIADDFGDIRLNDLETPKLHSNQMP